MRLPPSCTQVVGAALLALGLAFGARGAAAQEGARTARPMLLHAAPDSGYVYLSWNLVPATSSYQVEWRRQASGPWQARDVDSGSYHTAVTGLENDVAYEFRVLARGRDGMPARASAVVVQTPGMREECNEIIGFACTLSGFQSYLIKSGTGSRVLCEGMPLLQAEPETRNCAYYSGTEVIGFDRYYGRTFTGPDRLPSRALIREAGRRAIWGDEDPFVAPDRFPVEVRRLNEPDKGLVRADSAASYIIRLNPDVSSRFTMYWPPHPIPGWYVIYHEGHGLTANTSGSDVINWFLLKGWTVVGMDMPLEGSNATDARYPFDSHDALRWYRVPPRHALDLFLLPVKTVVDHVVGSSPVANPNIVLVGRSGGGWTACVYGALDARITVMVNISGCWPRNIALDPNVLNNPNVLHFETLQSVVFDQVSMLELMTASGTRGNFHFYSVNDPSITLRPTDAYIQYLLAIGNQENAQPATRHRTRVHIGEQKEHGLNLAAFDRLEEFLEDLHLPLPYGGGSTAAGGP